MSAPFETEITGGDMYSMQIWNHLKTKSDPSRLLQNKFKMEIALHIERNKNHSNHSDLQPQSRILCDTVGFLSPLHIVENHLHFAKEFGL